MEKELDVIALNIKKTIETYDNIVIVRHERPDCDAHGAALALKYMLKRAYPHKDIRYFAQEIADFPSFLGPEDPEDPEFYKKALLIAVDTANKERVSCHYIDDALEVIKIDHHPNTDPFGRLNYVDDSMPACCAILCRLAQEWGYTIPQEAMEPLYVGMVMDTGRFRYNGTNGEVMSWAGYLIDEGHLNLEHIYAHINIKDKSLIHLSGYVASHFKTTRHGVSYIVMTQALQAKYQASLDDCAGLVNDMDAIKGSPIWILFIETDQEFRISFRSRYINIVPLANQFNGGGHMNACGARLGDKTRVKDVIKAADKYLKNVLIEHPEYE